MNTREHQLIVLSARTPNTLQVYTQNMRDHLIKNPGTPLSDAAYTLQLGRKAFKYRQISICSDMDEAVAVLSDTDDSSLLAGKRMRHELTASNPRVVFLFPGQGAQYPGMGEELYKSEPLFRKIMDQCFSYLKKHMSMDLKPLIYPVEITQNRELHQTGNTQPVMFIFEYALSCLLISWGIKPSGMLGYSFGEYVAAVLAGVFSLEDALRLVAHRGKLMQELPSGAMLSVPLPEEELEPILKEAPGISMAIINGPSCVVAGSDSQIEAFEKIMKSRRVMTMRINAQHAAHSEMMETAAARFGEILNTVTFHSPEIPYISNITGKWISGEQVIDPRYWVDHMRHTVRFSDGLRELLKEKDIILVEVGPGRDLIQLAQRYMNSEAGHHSLNLIPPHQQLTDSAFYLMRRIGQLWLYGIAIDWNAYWEGYKPRRVPLPGYPFEPRVFPLPSLSKRESTVSKQGAGVVSSSSVSIITTDENRIQTDEAAYSFDNRPDLSTPFTEPENPIQQSITHIWKTIFSIDRLGIDDDFFELGGDSLKAIRAVNEIHRSFDVEITLPQFFKTPTARGLADFIGTQPGKNLFQTIQAVEEREFYPLSPAQRRIFILHQFETEHTGYNEPTSFLFEGTLDIVKVEDAFRQLIRRHESLRTSFFILDDEAIQRIHPDISFSVDYREIGIENGTEVSSTEIFKGFIRPFDLAVPPLIRVGVFKVEEQVHLMIVDIHHIISDGTTKTVLFHEFMELYEGRTLSPIQIQYKDYSQWLIGQQEGSRMRQQEEFWLNRFKEEVPAIDLPSDFPRPRIQRFEGGALEYIVEREKLMALKKIGSSAGNATLFMVLLSLFDILLHKLSGQEDIVTGTPISGRRHADFQPVVGMFVNTLALRNFPSPWKTFMEFLAEVKESTLSAYENQEYPFEELVDKIDIRRDAGRNPLFDILFVVQSLKLEVAESETGGLKMRPIRYDDSIIKFDLSFFGTDLEDRCIFNVEYSKSLFREETILRFLQYYTMIIDRIIENPFIRIEAVDIVSEIEKQKLLEEFNRITEPLGAGKTIIDIFNDRAEKMPDSLAVVGPCLTSDCNIIRQNSSSPDPIEKHYACLTYGELRDQARFIALNLRNRGVTAHSIVGIMIERSVQMVTGIMGILYAGCAYLPIDPLYPMDRIDYIIKDSSAAIVLKYEYFEEISTIFRETDSQNKLKTADEWIGTLEYGLPGGETLNRGTEALAYVIYTSGSTGRPKGVGIEHRNVVNLVHGLFEKIYHLYHGSMQVALIAPFVFDASVKQIFGALLLGHCLNIVSEDARFDGGKLINHFVRHQIQVTDGTPAHLKLMIENMGEEVRVLSLRHLLIGGEALAFSNVQDFFSNFIPERRPLPLITNVYGPTECCVDSTAYQISITGETGDGIVPIGKPLHAQYVVIGSIAKDENLQNKLMLQPVYVPGELMIGGANVGRGYLNNPELTGERFILIPNGLNRINQTATTTTIANIFYRTGDRARWTFDGNIEYLGRMDFQVKVRGFRIELGEIESKIASFPAVKETVVIDRIDDTGETYLCAYIVAHDTHYIDILELKEFLGRVLPGYMVPLGITQIESIPLTHNGKLNRRLLPDPTIPAAKEHSEPRDEIEEKLVDFWSQVLRLEKDRIGIDDNFFDLGGQSLKASIMVSRIHKAINVRIPLAEVFKSPYIRSMARYIRGAEQEEYIDVKPVEEKEYYPLSSAQKRLYVLQKMNPDGTMYNISYIMEIEGFIDRPAVESIFRQLILRHASFRTAFHILEDRPVQKVYNEALFDLEYFEIPPQTTAKNHIEEIITRFIRPFDLTQHPFLRIGLIELERDRHILMMDMHHIIADGNSLGILMKEFTALTHGESLNTLKLSYADFSEWQNDQFISGKTRKQEMYWISRFRDLPPAVLLPYDFERPLNRSYEACILRYSIPIEESGKLRDLARQENVTMYMLMLSLFYILLYKVTRQEDIIIGTITAGRRHPALEPIIGMFVNTLVFRNQPQSEKSFIAFLREIKQMTLDAFENQDYQFDDLVDKLAVKRTPGRNPLFDILFIFGSKNTFQSEENHEKIEEVGISMKPYKGGLDFQAKFDLLFTGSDTGQDIGVVIQYSTELFKQETIDRMIKYIGEIISSVIHNNQILLKDISVSHDLSTAAANVYNEQESDFDF